MMNSVKLSIAHSCKHGAFFEITDGLEALTLCYTSTWYMSIYYLNAYIILTQYSLMIARCIPQCRG